MDNIDFGRIAFVFEGDWNSTKTYSRLSVVRYPADGCGYVAIASNSSVIPGTNSSAWLKIVDKGDKGDEPQISLETDSEDNIYLLVDGVRVTGPGGTPLSFKGKKGDKGDKGEKGDKGNDGIPGSDATVTDEAIAALGYTKNAGTVTAVKINNTTKNPTSSGVVNLGTVLTAHQDISGKENTSNKVTSLSASSTNTQYPSAKCVYDELAGKQPLIDASHKLDYNLLTNVPASVDVSGKEDKSNKVTSISASSTNLQYPTAKCVYTIVGNIEALLTAI